MGMNLTYTETSGDLVYTPEGADAVPVIYNNGDMAFSEHPPSDLPYLADLESSP
jgi:hypothetical protein